jgi:glycosyltransferase involved in cell wall biosynthesis
VSIVTVIFNSAATLDDTLASVAGQTYPHIDHVLVDGGSTDDTVAMLKEAQQQWPDRVQWISEPDDGIYEAMNKGIRMARGDVIGIVNSDDLLADDRVIEDVVRQLEITGADALCADLVFADPNETEMVHAFGSHDVVGCSGTGTTTSHAVRKGSSNLERGAGILSASRWSGTHAKFRQRQGSDQLSLRARTDIRINAIRPAAAPSDSHSASFASPDIDRR